VRFFLARYSVLQAEASDHDDHLQGRPLGVGDALERVGEYVSRRNRPTRPSVGHDPDGHVHTQRIALPAKVSK
jgi:hypothetical protein